jgi:hypothetical protein
MRTKTVKNKKPKVPPASTASLQLPKMEDWERQGGYIHAQCLKNGCLVLDKEELEKLLGKAPVPKVGVLARRYGLEYKIQKKSNAYIFTILPIKNR